MIAICIIFLPGFFKFPLSVDGEGDRRRGQHPPGIGKYLNSHYFSSLKAVIISTVQAA
jgi:hypothetical protein